MDSNGKDIFISYASADILLAKKLKQLLETELNLTVFLSEENLGEVTDNWREDIINNIRKSKCFIPILTKTALNRPWVMYESGAADIQGVPFFVVTTSWTRQADTMGFPRGDKFVYSINKKEQLERLIHAIYHKFYDREFNRSLTKNSYFNAILTYSLTTIEKR